MATKTSLALIQQICGLNFQVEVDEGPRTADIFNLWKGLFAAGPGDDGPVDARVRFEQCEDARSRLRIPAEASLVAGSGEKAVYRSNSHTWSSARGMVCSIGAAGTEIAIDESYWTRSLFDQRDFLLVVMAMALRVNGVYAFHGNALSHDGAGIVITGDSGAGKTTLTHALISSGWRFLADDAIAFQPANGRLEARALRRGFALTEDARNRKMPPPLWDSSALLELGNGKYLAHPTPAVEEQFIHSCVPSALFFSQVGDVEETRIEQISSHTALLLALKQAAGLLIDPGSTRPQLNTLRDLVEQCACFRITSGRDVVEDEESIRRVSDLVLEAARTERLPG